VMRISLSGEDGIRTGEWLESVLPEHEFRIAGHLVADITVSAVHRRTEGKPAMTLTIEALTVEAD